MLHAAAALFAAFSLVLVPATTQLDPVLQYEGTITAMDAGGEGDGSGVGSPVTATIDCSSDPCMFSGVATGGDVSVGLTGQGPVPYNGTSQTYDVPAAGDV